MASGGEVDYRAHLIRPRVYAECPFGKGQGLPWEPVVPYQIPLSSEAVSGQVRTVVSAVLPSAARLNHFRRTLSPLFLGVRASGFACRLPLLSRRRWNCDIEFGDRA